MNSFGFLFISKSLLSSIRELRKQTLEAVTEILKDCSSSFEKEVCLLGGVKKEISIFSRTLGFDIDGKLYEIIEIPGSEKRLKILEEEDAELLIQKSWFMPQLEKIFNLSQENKKKKPKEEK